MNASYHLYIGALGVHHVTTLGESHQLYRTGIGLVVGIVLVGQLAPQAFHAEILAPLEFLEQRDAVEYLSVEVPRHVKRGIAVVEELHVVDEVESLVLYDIREIGGWRDEQGEGNLRPLDATLEVAVYLSPAVHPEALIDAGFGHVIGILAAQESLDADGVADGEDGGVEVDLDTTLLGVDERLAGREAQFTMQLCGAYFPVVQVVGIDGCRHFPDGREKHVAAGLVLLCLETESGLEAPLLLALESELLAVVEHHFLDVTPLERCEHIILVGMNELIGGRAHIIGGCER